MKNSKTTYSIRQFWHSSWYNEYPDKFLFLHKKLLLRGFLTTPSLRQFWWAPTISVLQRKLSYVILTLVLLNKLRRHTFFKFFSQSDYLIQIVDIKSHTEWQTVQIQISWLLQKPTDLDLHCLLRQCISRFSRIRVKNSYLQISSLCAYI